MNKVYCGKRQHPKKTTQTITLKPTENPAISYPLRNDFKP
jgi:hypothetical protein